MACAVSVLELTDTSAPYKTLRPRLQRPPPFLAPSSLLTLMLAAPAQHYHRLATIAWLLEQMVRTWQDPKPGGQEPLAEL